VAGLKAGLDRIADDDRSTYRGVLLFATRILFFSGVLSLHLVCFFFGVLGEIVDWPRRKGFLIVIIGGSAGHTLFFSLGDGGGGGVEVSLGIGSLEEIVVVVVEEREVLLLLLLLVHTLERMVLPFREVRRTVP